MTDKESDRLTVAEHQFLQEEFFLQIDKDSLPASFRDERSCALLPAAIDCGTALIKIIHLTTESAEKSFLHFALFDSQHMEAALDWLSQRLTQRLKEVENSVGREKQLKLLLRVTGAGVQLHGDRMKERLGVDLEIINESVSHCFGFHYLLTHFPNLADFCHPAPAIDESAYEGMLRGETFQKMCDAQTELMGQRSNQDDTCRFPCMLAVFGSTARVFMIREDGSFEEKYSNQFAGKTFLGCCQLLIDTSNYKEILLLAEAGNRGNIDSQIKDLMDDVPNSPYGKMPLSMPLFTFGKAVDFDNTLEDASREDVAQSLVSAFSASLAYPVIQMASFDGIGNVYLGGQFLRQEFARAEVIRSTKFFSAADLMNLKFLKICHTAALGALLQNHETSKK